MMTRIVSSEKNELSYVFMYLLSTADQNEEKQCKIKHLKSCRIFWIFWMLKKT